MFNKVKQTYREFPKPFWVLVLGTFIDQLGGFMLFPFYSIYVMEHFEVTMIEVGLLFSMYAIGALFGGFLGGMLTDKYGRRSIMLFGLVISGLGSLLMGFINDLTIFYIISLLLGALGDIGMPAQQAMVADLLPEKQQMEGFGILRISMNISATIGPALGGLLASSSYMYLFGGDAISSILTAILVLMVIPETKPPVKEEKQTESLIETLKGYKYVFKDSPYMIFLLISCLVGFVYMQMSSTLSIFLLNEHGFSYQMYGYLISMNALIVVCTQFWLTRKVSKYPPLKVIAEGTLLYAIGFGMYGFVSSTFMFFVAMVIITVGEMINAPVSEAIVARLAPEDKRGRYMAVFGFSWFIPNLMGVVITGTIMEKYNSNWVWYICGITSMVAVFGYTALYRWKTSRASCDLSIPADDSDTNLHPVPVKAGN
ncbi:Multidrug resistance protein MdtH [Candidatus Lokiarchaeum ossiferum]|uniref:Multidrug resistance protein MdtH n=1 Tax=Candidatus Lokiarchaeum ossiferum TaxID=2951803 RepID=A0ABY6HST7_9ARCH|nr:Multidrug resistance protein MdtH [Candidatus Lokiarchaeum sp. B-35]